MSGALPLTALVAMIPAMLGPPHGSGGQLTLTLCNGGSLTIETPGEPSPDPDSQACAKGCHSGCSRKWIDRAQ